LFQALLKYFSYFYIISYLVFISCTTGEDFDSQPNNFLDGSNISREIESEKALVPKEAKEMNSVSIIPQSTPLPSAPAATPLPPAPAQPTLKKNYISIKPTIVPVQRPSQSKTKSSVKILDKPIVLDTDQKLNFAVRAPAYHVRPWKEGSDQRTWMTSAFMPIFRFDSDNNIQPSVALDYAISENQLEYTIFLDPEAIFTDGSKLTARHIKENLEFGSIPEQQVSWGALTSITRLILGCDDLINGFSDQCVGLEVVDDHILLIKLNEVHPTFPKELSKWLTGIQKIDNVKQNPDWEKNPIGVGPFVVNWDSESGEVNLKRTNNHWIDYSGTISDVNVVPIIDSKEQLDLYSSSKLDLIIATPSNQPMVYNIGSKYFSELHPIPYGGVFYYAFDVSQSPFDDLNFRKAVISSVDVPQINRSVFSSREKSAFGWLTPETACFDEYFQNPIPYNPQKAKEYFASSQYYSLQKLDLPALRISHKNHRKDWVAWSQGFQAMLGFNLGIPVEILLEDSIFDGQVNFGRFSQTITDADPYFILWNLSHPDSDVLKSQFRFTDSYLEQLIENAVKIPVNSAGGGLQDANYSNKERCDAFREIEMYLLSNAYGIPIIQVNHQFLVKPWVEGFRTSVNYDITSLASIKISQRQ